MYASFVSLWDLQQYIASAGMEQLRSEQDNDGTMGIIICHDEKIGSEIQHNPRNGDVIISNMEYPNELCWLFEVYARQSFSQTGSRFHPLNVFPEVYAGFIRNFINNGRGNIPYTAREMLLYINYEMMILESGSYGDYEEAHEKY